MTTSICEAGIEVSLDQQCWKCGAFPSGSCKGPKPPNPAIKIIEDLRSEVTRITKEWRQQNEITCSLKQQLNRYKEREATQGWADD